jgi:hypothetical protein
MRAGRGIYEWLKRHSQAVQNVRPARPQRVKTRGGTYRTSCGPFALAMGRGERKSPTLLSTSEELLFNVEVLNDARTLLADFFSILLACPLPSLLRLASVCNLFPSRSDLMDEAVKWQHGRVGPKGTLFHQGGSYE